MAISGKKDKKGSPAAPKAAGKGAPSPKQPKPSKQPKPYIPPDIYTLFLGLSALFFIVSALVLGLNYYWYQSPDIAVIPMNWVK